MACPSWSEPAITWMSDPAVPVIVTEAISVKAGPRRTFFANASVRLSLAAKTSGSTAQW